MSSRQQRSNAPRKLYPIYLTEAQHRAVVEVAGRLSFSAYAASAVLREAARDGALFYGDVRGGSCARADPERGEVRCKGGEEATWWNRLSRAWFCPSCALRLNELEPGACIGPDDLRQNDG